MATSTNFDDRIDTETELTMRETLGLLGRSLRYLNNVRLLFLAKLMFALVAVLPSLALPWILKIIVDQVILAKPFDATDVRTPTFLLPFVNAVEGFSPAEIMLAVAALLAILLVVFGMRAPPAIYNDDVGVGQPSRMPQGQDSATRSEQAISAGGSDANGIWGFVEVLLTIRMTQRLANSLRTKLMGRLTRLEMTTLDDQRIGDSVYRVMYDAPLLPDICFRLTVRPIYMIFSLVITIYLMRFSYGAVAPEIVWIGAAIVPLTLLFTLPMSGFARRVHQVSRAAGAATTNTMEESIDNVAAVQALGGTQQEASRFAARSRESFRRFRHTVFVDGLIKIVTYTAATIGMAYAFILITNDVIAGTLSPGDFAVLVGLLFLLIGIGMQLGMYWIELQQNVAAVRRVFFFIDYIGEDDRETQALKPLSESIAFDNVSFSYPDGREALSEVNLEMPLGEIVAIVGPTGAGKTTLAYLLPGYLRPTEGRIRFDDQDIARVHVDDLRQQVTYVFQEHMLLSDTIRENLALARHGATEEEMLAACRTAGAMEFIDRLPHGLDTVIGKSGDTLSVGQKQRLSIARGLLRNTAVIVLDEPTAALDPQTENALMAALRDTAKGRLVVVIAHRLSTIRKADRIVFLEKGRVVDVGDHDSLMADPKGRYRQFVELQSG